jgi:LAO/AO transport system kinase
MIDIKGVLSGNRLALSRLLTQVESQTKEGAKALSTIFPQTGNAHLIGITGAPGTGKSSLVNQLALHYRNPKNRAIAKKVAIIAVDPSSPYSGGAVLGDRIRMNALHGDKGVFIRSMASRGSLGGLATSTAGMVRAFDAAGYEIIIIETVGAGQAEVDIAKLAHTTIVVEAPGLGDDIQAIKAGILEIADILVVNKADRPGVENTERALRGMLQLAHPGSRVFQHHNQTMKIEMNGDLQDKEIWFPPIILTQATDGMGVQSVIDEIANHQEFLESSGDMENRRRARLASEIDQKITKILVSKWMDGLAPNQYNSVLNELMERKISPQDAIEGLLKEEIKK